MKVCILRSPTKTGYIFIHKVDQSLCPCLTNLVLGAVGILDSPCLSVRHPCDTVWRKIDFLGKSIFYDFYTKYWSKILVDHWYTLSSYCICYYDILLFSFHFLLMHCLPITLIFWLCTLAFQKTTDVCNDGYMFSHAKLPRYQGSWGQHGAHLGSVGPRWAHDGPLNLAIRVGIKLTQVFSLLGVVLLDKTFPNNGTMWSLCLIADVVLILKGICWYQCTVAGLFAKTFRTGFCPKSVFMSTCP